MYGSSASGHSGLEGDGVSRGVDCEVQAAVGVVAVGEEVSVAKGLCGQETCEEDQE